MPVTYDFEDFGLTVEPEERDIYSEHFAEFIRDENDRIIGIRFTKQ